MAFKDACRGTGITGKATVMSTKRLRFKQTGSLEERLKAEAEVLRDRAADLPPGHQRDMLLRKAHQTKTGSWLAEWISSPGPRSPE